MTINKIIKTAAAIAAIALTACSKAPVAESEINALPPICPDYCDVSYPPNLVAPHFMVPDSCGYKKAYAYFTSGATTKGIDGKNCKILISASDWQELKNSGDEITVRILGYKDKKWTAFKPFTINIAPDSIDRYLTYRLIEPGYEAWYEMGLYQRDLESYDVKELIANSRTDHNCINCHTYCQQNPQKMLLHMRKDHGGTYLIDNGEISKLDTKTPHTISALVYPYWHPSGRFVAFSTNDTHQLFHTTNPNRIEVMDYASDIVIYDTASNQIFTAPQLSSTDAFETFPCFSPDGKTLYFCTASAQEMPADYDKVNYSICAIGFDADNQMFSESVDTIYNADDMNLGSASFPRVSPDGKWLIATISGYGNFSIWHRDADLCLIDLAAKAIKPVDAINSDETESYHAWSANGQWMVVSSRRVDGLYTRPYLTRFNADGTFTKPFILPQHDPEYYQQSMKSFNVPEFSSGLCPVAPAEIEKAAKSAASKQINFKS